MQLYRSEESQLQQSSTSNDIGLRKASWNSAGLQSYRSEEKPADSEQPFQSCRSKESQLK